MYEEFVTLIAQIQSYLNLRRFVAVATDSNNFIDMNAGYCFIGPAFNKQYETSYMEGNRV